MKTAMAVCALLALAALASSADAFKLRPFKDMVSGDAAANLTDFDAWAKAHGKTYAPEEYELRKAAFERSLAAIGTANSANGLAQFGIHKYADRTVEELEAMFLGHKAQSSGATNGDDDDEEPDGPPDDKPHPWDYGYIEPPARVDWREIPNVLGPVKSQHVNNTPCGCCWAFATTGVIESVHGLIYGEQVSVSEQELISCDRDTKMDEGCKGGDVRWGMAYVAKNEGISFESEYPYEGKDSMCNTEIKNKQNRVRITGFHEVPDKSEHAFMQAVSQQPIAIGVSVGKANLDTWHAYKGGILDPATLCFDMRDKTCKTDHAMVLVGYGEEDGIPFWVLKNSWSTEWGEEGFMRIRRDFDGPEGYGPLAMYHDATYPVIEYSWGEQTKNVAELLKARFPNAMWETAPHTVM